MLGGAAAVIIIPLVTWLVLISAGILPQPGKAMFPPFNLSDRLSMIPVEEGPDGDLIVIYDRPDFQKTYRADEFLAEVQKRQADNEGWRGLFNALDITSWASLCWIAFGFGAQAVFMSRMVIQWLASEKARSSVVPPAFWWLSLLGASMLIIYYIWRKDPVSILAQGFGWSIYLRNLWFIYGKPKPVTAIEEEKEIVG